LFFFKGGGNKESLSLGSYGIFGKPETASLSVMEEAVRTVRICRDAVAFRIMVASAALKSFVM
jgi:hypothetical protein